MAGRIAEFYEAKLQRSLDRIVGIAGPAAIITISIVVGGLIVLVMTSLSTRCSPPFSNRRAAGPTIRHFASGMSCGGAIALTREGVGYQVRVNWLGGAEVVLVN